MEEDPIMQELRQIRRDLLKEADGDLGKLLERADQEAPRLLAPFRKTAQSETLSRRSHRPSSKAPARGAFRTQKSKSPKV